MPNVRLLAAPLAVILILAIADVSRAQFFQPFGSFEHSHDMQPFAPVEYNQLVDWPEPNTGFFFTYDRMNLNVTRPAASGAVDNASFEGDWAWGNRLDLGYMTDKRHGWLAEVFRVDGPNVHTNPSSQTNLPPGPSENVMTFTSVEVMKQWRWKPLHRGSHVELFLGGRYAYLESFDVFENQSPSGVLFQGVVSNNHMYGPQIGLRWFKQKDRLTLSAEGRYFYAYNQQFFGSGNAENAIPLAFQDQHWVHAGDLRLEATCDFTKSFALAVGFEMLYLGNGVARGAPPFNDQDTAMTGWTIGFKLNR